tara:strand:- start:352 stop:828 length:477 start_codon:yes stop_codon:yes gene_type:complete
MSKINLIYGSGDVLHTHVNINPFAEEEDGKTIIRGDIKNLDKYCDDCELSELIATDVIDYVPHSENKKTLENWIKKIRIGGKIVIGGIDMFEVCKSVSLYEIDTFDANILLHGDQTKPYIIRKSNFTAVGLSEYLESKGFKIIKKRIKNYRMVVEGER